MADYGRKYREETGESAIYVPHVNSILAPVKPPIPDEIQEQINTAKSFGSKSGFSIRRGLGSPATSQNWYVCKQVGRRGFDVAPGCPKPEGFKSGGFETLEEAIACFQSL